MTQAPARFDIFQYGALALPLAFAGLPLYVHAPDFYARHMGLNLGLIGAILLFIRLLDAVQDPLIGYLSDRFAVYRVRIMLLGGGLLLAGMGMLFAAPVAAGVSQFPSAAWFGLSAVLAACGFSIVSINLTLVGAFWSETPAQQNRISAWREGLGLGGLLLASILPALLQHFMPAISAFQIMFVVFAVLLLSGLLLFTRFAQGLPKDHKILHSGGGVKISVLPILLSPARPFYLICFFTHLAASLPGVLVMFFINNYLNAAPQAGLFLFLYFMAGAAGMMVWVKMANRMGAKKAWLASMLLAVASFIWAFMLQPGDILPFAFICVLSGLALGADLALPPVLLRGMLRTETQQDNATQYFAVLAFIPKAALAIASGFALMLLAQMGFTAGGDNSAEALSALAMLYALIPCLFKLISAALLWRSLNTENENDQNVERSIPDELHDGA
jgi:GPH family glycoside/pentoside/hexuronide:cation symporter